MTVSADQTAVLRGGGDPTLHFRTRRLRLRYIERETWPTTLGTGAGNDIESGETTGGSMIEAAMIGTSPQAWRGHIQVYGEASRCAAEEGVLDPFSSHGTWLHTCTDKVFVGLSLCTGEIRCKTKRSHIEASQGMLEDTLRTTREFRAVVSTPNSSADGDTWGK